MFRFLARVEGIGPPLEVLETSVLPLYDTRLRPPRRTTAGKARKFAEAECIVNNLFRLLVSRVLSAFFAKLFDLQLFFDFLLVPSGVIIDSFAGFTLLFDEIVLRHDDKNLIFIISGLL